MDHKTVISGAVAIMLTIIVAAMIISETTTTLTPSVGTTYSYNNTLENSGTAYLVIVEYDEIKTGTISGKLLVSDNVQLETYVNDAVVDNRNTGSDNISLDVLSSIVDGQNSWQVSIDNEARLSAAYTTTSAVTTYEKSLGEKLREKEESKFPTIFTLLILVAIIAVIMIVLRQIGMI